MAAGEIYPNGPLAIKEVETQGPFAEFSGRHEKGDGGTPLTHRCPSPKSSQGRGPSHSEREGAVSSSQRPYVHTDTEPLGCTLQPM